MPVQTEHDPRLKQSLKTRHLSMISLGGVIGAGLFVGSSAIISEAGPGAFLIYGLTGLLVALVMRMLGEMASAHPTTGSFTDYSGGGTCNWSPTSPPNGVRHVEAGRVESCRQVPRHRLDLPVLWRLGRLLVEPASGLSGTLAPPHRARVALLAE